MPNQPAPRNRTLYKLSLDEMIDRTGVAKSETKSKSTSPATQITLPMPDGTFKDFRIWESSLMEKGLADKFPEIQTYIIKGKNDPTVSGRMMVSPYEFSAFFAAPAKGYEVFVRKVYKGDANTYMSYYGKDDPTRREELQCGFEEDLNANPPVSLSSLEKALVAPDTGPELLLFRLAISFPGATSEYNGYATKAEALAGIVSFLSEINAIYERDMSMRFVLPENQDEIIWVDDATDPFSSNGGNLSIYENQIVQRQYIGTENYDLGFVFVLGGCCGVRGRVCNDDNKEISMNRFRWLAGTTHEIGHQFSASHTWTSCGPSNNGQYGTNEFGSGTSIMSYIGTCNVDNIPNAGDVTFFGVYSRFQMINYASTLSCGKTLLTGNTAPTITVPDDDFYIPKETPFVLVGTGSDAEGDQITYSWEQTNLYNVDFTAGLPVAQTPEAADGDVPLHRIFNPVSSPERTIPQLPIILDSSNVSIYERLPTYTRGFKYSLYARDNHPGAGGTTFKEVSFNVDASAGPFRVSSQNTCLTWTAGGTETVTWDVAGTNAGNVNVATVNILLSIDGGYNWDYTLASGTNNDGTESITVPSGVCSDQVRVKVEAVGNYFFDINDVDFSIDDGSSNVTTPMALQFNGLDDAVDISSTVGNFGTGDFTIEVNIKTDHARGIIASKRAECNLVNFWNIELSSEGKVAVALFQGDGGPNHSLTGITNVADGNWHHIAVTRTSNLVKIFVDGVDEGVSNNMTANLNNTAVTKLGANICTSFGETRFKGEMTEFRLWTDARIPTEIDDNKLCRLLGTEDNLEVYFPMEITNCSGCSGSSILTDVTANNNHGHPVNEMTRVVRLLDVEECPTCTNGNIIINTQPANASVADEATANFSVTASGNNLSYQWAVSTDGGTTFESIVGANTATYSLTADSRDNGNQYRCHIVNGCDVQTSTAATLTVSCSALSLSAITGEATPCENNYYSYYVTPNPDVVTWSWTAPSGWTVTNFDNMIFVQVGSGSGNVSLTATDACGNMDTKNLAVSPVLVEITTHPLSQSASEGNPVAMTVAISGGGGSTTYLWQQSTDGGTTYSDIASSNSTTYNIAAATIAHDDRRYRCIIENSCLIDTSNVAILNVNCSTSAPLNTDQVQGPVVICGNSTLIYSIPPIPGADTYNWTLPGGWSGTSTTNSISVTTNGTGGILKVSATNGCGTSDESILDIIALAGDCPRALHFDGIDDYATAAQNSQYLSGDMTVSLWVNPTSTTGLQHLIFNGTEFEIALRDGQVVYRHTIYGGSYDDSVDETFTHSAFRANEWRHITIVRDVSEREVSLYLDGELFETKQWGTAFPSTPDDNEDYPLTFGAGANGLVSFYHGSMDEVKIWQAARTATQVLEDQYCSATGSETNLLAYYDFEQGQANGNNTGIISLNNTASAYAAIMPVNLT